MKQIILTVQITASVPDNADLEAIHLDNKREDFKIVHAGSPVHIHWYETIDVVPKIDDGG